MTRPRTRAAIAMLAMAACSPGDGESHAPRSEAESASVEEVAPGEVKVGDAELEHMGVKLAPLAAAETRDELELVGRVVEDPSRTFVVRAPIAGTLVASGAWPSLGNHLADDAEPGSITPRLSAAERLDLAARAAQARADAAVAAEEVRATQRELERAEKLNALDKAVSDSALEEVQARADLARVRVEAADGESRRLQAALADGATLTGVTLRIPGGGEVLEVLASPGEALEAGTPILRLVHAGAALVEVALPLGELAPLPPRLRSFAHADRWLDGEVVLRRAGPGGNSVLLVRAPDGSADLRPGDAVVVHVPRSDRATTGRLLPSSAVVRTAGRAWCWVALDAQRYERRLVSLEHPASTGWVITDDWARDARVAVEGAQALLSFELLSDEKGASSGD